MNGTRVRYGFGKGQAQFCSGPFTLPTHHHVRSLAQGASNERSMRLPASGLRLACAMEGIFFGREMSRSGVSPLFAYRTPKSKVP